MASKASKDVTHSRRQMKNKCSFLRFLVIVLSFISLLSRVIYCTFATWLTITTFDCHPCPNATAITANTSTPLFISHHSSALFKSVRGLNIESKETVVKLRRKRAQRLSQKTVSKSSQFISVANGSLDAHFNDTKDQLAFVGFQETFDFDMSANRRNGSQPEANATQVFLSIERITKESNASHNSTKDFMTIDLNEQLSDGSKDSDLLEVNMDDVLHDAEDSKKRKRDSDPLFMEVLDLNDDEEDKPKTTNETHVERFTYIPSDELLNKDNILHEVLEISDSKGDSAKPSNNSSEWQDWLKDDSPSDDSSSAITMTILLDAKEITASNDSLETTDPRKTQNNLNDDQLVNDTQYISSEADDSSKILIEVCSEDCSQFLSFELNDASMRKWATIVITGVLYVYAFVMFAIFMGACLALVDVLVIATFIEGAKLFAGFILMIIDSFNGKGVEFNLIDIRFNVNDGGNGWSADFSYSEYLLDVIIFFLSAYLCIRVFKCFEKKPKKVPSVEELVDTRGTYRPNPSRNDLEPIFECN
ncbi:unnamed protein product [Medioppia subpectinata]|uniref:Uncharacterized protein n=1 Tax=Medioppia subpectinata TaxID=1979941 RepID=A0A7R9KDI3_9ACAR|nr:unnamed protein product [Medioppia subpectinata]CAG2101511.1 unnamed protein product [Medioppia subpectinata]